MFKRRSLTNDITVIGVTGGIACGKSAVCNILAKRGAVIIDADSIGHDLLIQNTMIKRNIYETFGEIVLDADREIDRKRLGNIVFGNKKKLQQLNEIVHPHLLMKVRNYIDKFKRSLKEGIIVVNAALIVEWKITSLFDYIILVESLMAARIKRLVKDKGLTRKQANDRIKSQLPVKVKEKWADYIIKNDKTLREVRTQTLKIIKEIKKERKIK
jgi:dephospho-CoA kinase